MRLLIMVLSLVFVTVGIGAPDIYKQYDQACKLYNQGQDQQALIALKSIIAENPDWPESYEKLAKIYYRQNAIEEGLSYFDSLAVYHRKGLALYGKALILKSERKYPEAINLLRDVIQNQCSHVRLYVLLGQLYALSDQVPAGEAFFKNLSDGNCVPAHRYCGLGRMYRQSRNKVAALREYEKAVSQDTTPALAVRSLAGLYLTTNPNKSKILFDKWFAFTQTGEQFQDYYYTMGQYWLIMQSDMQQARYHFKKSLQIAKALNDTTFILSNSMHLGSIHDAEGNRRKARGLYEFVIRHSQVGSNTFLRVQTYLADSYAAEGNFRAATAIYSDVLKYAIANNKMSRKYVAMFNMANMLLTTGNLSDALNYYQQCEIYYAARNNMNLLPHILNSLGVLFSERGDYKKALLYNERALQLSKEIGNRGGVVNRLLSKAESEIRLGKYHEAARTIEEARQLAPIHGVDIELTEIERLKGLLHEESGNLQQALASYQSAYDKESDSRRPYLFVPILEGLARVSIRMNDNQQALHWLKEAVQVIDTVKTDIGVEEMRRSFVSSRISVFDRMIDTQLRIYTPESRREAFKYTEKAKAQSLQNLLNQAASITAMNLPDSLSFALDNIQFKIEENYHKIRALESGKTAAPDSIIRLQQENLALELRSDSLKNEITPSPQQPGLLDRTFITVASLQKMLQSDEIVLEYKVTADRLIAFLVTQKQFIVKSQPITRDSLTTLVAGILRNLKDGTLTSSDLNTLYNLLVEPFETNIASNDKLIIIPDEALFYLPFESLITDVSKIESARDFRNCRFLIEQNPIVYFASAALLNKVVPRNEAPKNNFLGLATTAFSDTALQTLIYTKKEIVDVATLIPGPNSVLKDDTAIKAMYKQKAGQFKINHIATHILVDDNQPMYSKIMLHGGEDLYAYEVINIKTTADMIVLSGCNSALGQLLPGEGFVGMSQAFMVAGAQSLLMSLWSVNDQSTAKFMLKFYENLKAGSPKHEALQQAKISMLREEGGSADPFLWAPFVLTGQTAPIDFSSDAEWARILWVVAVLVLISTFVIRRRKPVL